MTKRFTTPETRDITESPVKNGIIERTIKVTPGDTASSAGQETSIVVTSLASQIYTGGLSTVLAPLFAGFGGLFTRSKIVETQTGQPKNPNDLIVQTSAYGQPIYKLYGRQRVGGIAIWARDIEEVRLITTTITPQGDSGKGALKTNTVRNTSFLYFGTFALAFCAGEISQFLKLWGDSKLIYNIDTNNKDTLTESAKMPIVKYFGDEQQLPSPVIESFDGIGNVTAFRGLAYIVFDRLPLANFGNRIPSFTAEIQA